MKYPKTIFNKIVLIGLVFLMAGLKGTGLGFFSIGDSHRVFVREPLGMCNLGTSSSVYSTQHQTRNYDWILILLPLCLLNNNLCYYRIPFFTANEVICQDNLPSFHFVCSPGEPHQVPGDMGDTAWEACPQVPVGHGADALLLSREGWRGTAWKALTLTPFKQSLGKKF